MSYDSFHHSYIALNLTVIQTVTSLNSVDYIICHSHHQMNRYCIETVHLKVHAFHYITPIFHK